MYSQLTTRKEPNEIPSEFGKTFRLANLSRFLGLIRVGGAENGITPPSNQPSIHENKRPPRDHPFSDIASEIANTDQWVAPPAALHEPSWHDRVTTNGVAGANPNPSGCEHERQFVVGLSRVIDQDVRPGVDTPDGSDGLCVNLSD